TYYSWAMLLNPSNTTGVIVSHEKEWDDESGDMYYLHFAYDRDGVESKGCSSVSKDHYAQIKDGTKWPVFYTKLVPNSGAELDVPERRNMGYFFAPFITFFALFWNLISWTGFFCIGRTAGRTNALVLSNLAEI